MKKIQTALIAVLMIPLLSGLVTMFSQSDSSDARSQLVETSLPAVGFARVNGPSVSTFPSDHGPHPDYQTEWWYYTGNLETADGRHFGFQLTFFRRALLPSYQRQDRPSNWATDQIYLAHFALTDVAAGQVQASERFSRGAVGLAGAQHSPYRVWLEDWWVEEQGPGVYRLRARQDDVELDLRLSDLKGPILQGDRGYSQKGPEPGNASFYYSLTRLAATGTVRVGGTAHEVDGLSWMDHEYSTSALGSDLVGWDWFSVQLDDGSELMLYQLRRQDGAVDGFSSGTFIDAKGRTTALARDEFSVAAISTWRSPRSGATYPAQWTIAVPSKQLDLKIKPYHADQELIVGYTYWEGAVDATGTRAGKTVNGSGYVELTGYAASMQGEL
jgi:predicted secreted hydrolase